MMKSIVIGSLLVLAMGSQVSIADVNRAELQGTIGAVAPDPFDPGDVDTLAKPAPAGKPAAKPVPANGVKSPEDFYMPLN